MIETSLPPLSPALTALGVHLRRRAAEDAEFLRDVYVAYRWEEVTASGWPEAMRLAFLHDQYRAQCFHYENNYEGAVWGVIEVGKQRAGRLYLHHSSLELRIIDIALMPEFHNRGLGSALLASVQTLARQLGVARVSIHVESNNPALKLYQRLGFEEIELRGIYYLMEWPVI